MGALKPILENSERIFYRQWPRMTSDLAAAYGQGILAGVQCRRLSDGFSAFVQPFEKIFPRTWAMLRDAARDASIVEMLSVDGDQLSPLSLVPLFPVPGGFCTFTLYFGLGPSPNSDEEDLLEFRARVAKLPGYFQEFVLAFEEMGFHCNSADPLLPDAQLLGRIPWASSSVADIASGPAKRRLKKRFADLENMVLIASGISPPSWHIFFDNAESGEGTMFVALDSEFKETHQLNDAQAAFDALFSSHLEGRGEEFDFRPFV